MFKPLFYILLFLPFSVFAQTPEYPDSGFTNKAEAKNLTVNHKKEGKWIKYCKNIEGFPEMEDEVKDSSTADYYCLICYKKGRPFGVKRWYSMKGVIQREVIFDKQGKVNGLTKDYYQNGKLMSETMFKNNGVGVDFDKEYYENGKLKSLTVYKGDSIQLRKNYDENGNEIKK